MQLLPQYITTGSHITIDIEQNATKRKSGRPPKHQNTNKAFLLHATPEPERNTKSGDSFRFTL